MEQKAGRHSGRNGPPRGFLALGLSLLLAMFVSGTAFAQTGVVTGTVTGASGGPLQGVTVRVVGAETRALTNANGRFSITAPGTGTLTFNLVGQHPTSQPIGGRTVVNVTMSPIAYLEEVVVTAYSEQRRADITGAVASINVESAARQTSASVLQKLDVVPGITVASSGSPGARSTVRIRGISSFQNNDPLYVIDGTPVQDSYINFLNPADITSIQVLKDASAASIYGSRASNGVIVIETTKKGSSGPPRMTVTARQGIAAPVKGYNDILITNALDYFQVLKAENGDHTPTNIYGDPNNPTVPAYIYAEKGTYTSLDQYGRPVGVDVSKYSYPNSLIMPGSAGTDWWSAVFSKAPVGDYNVNVSGSGEDHTYTVSGNYFNQQGTAAYNDYRRGTVRANTSFQRSKVSFGENVAVAAERSNGGMAGDPGGYAEDGILGKNILMQPVVPIYDVGGHFAGGKANSLGNQTNAYKFAYEHRNDINSGRRIFGNVFGGLAATSNLSFRSSIGFNTGENAFAGYNPISPELSEPSFSNGVNENDNNFTDWTWSNTARYNKSFSSHTFNFLLGQEANHSTNRYIQASMNNLLNTDLDSRYIQSTLGDPATRDVFSTGGQSALLSYFGKADYNFQDKYVASFTVRRDGSSRLGPDHRWGTFPAFGLGWRITKEKFLENNHFLSDAMLRFGVGVTGNQQIPAGRINTQFGGGLGDTYYSVQGNNSISPGYRATALGNPDLKWEDQKATNVGADLAFFDGNLNVIVDLYSRNTNNLLFDPALPATAGFANPPIVNIGKVQNKGYDISIGHQGANWNATLQGGHYSNKIVNIDGVQTSFLGPNGNGRLNQQSIVINQLGESIGAFYGLVANGFFKDAADIAASPKQDGALPGRIKFKDLNGDGVINDQDRQVIGNPNPKFTGGLDLGYRRGNWDISSTIFGSFGNDIFDSQKDYYIFHRFDTNVRKDLLANSWTPTHQDAKYPMVRADMGPDQQVSSFWLEDGTYVRLRNVQIGWNVPSSLSHFLSATRIYVQGENMLTLTRYDGLDPSLPNAAIQNNSGADIRDQYRGVDRGAYPSNKTFSIGVTTSF